MTTLALDYKTGFNNAVSNVATFLPKLVAFLVILIIGYIIAKVLAKVVNAVLEKVGFDSAVERGGIKAALAKSQYDASDILAKLVFYAVMLFVLSTAFGVFGNNPISAYLAAVIAYLPLVFVAILIIVIASAVAAAVKSLISNSLGGLSYGSLLANAASGLILAFGVIAALNQLHIATNVVNGVLYVALATIAGILIIAVGGGGISPMRARWESTLSKYDAEKPNIASAAKSAPSVKAQAQQAASSVSADTGSSRGSSFSSPDAGGSTRRI